MQLGCIVALENRLSYLHQQRTDIQRVLILVRKVPDVSCRVVHKDIAILCEAIRETLGQKVCQELQHFPVGSFSLQESNKTMLR